MKKFWMRILTPNLLALFLFEEGTKRGLGIWIYFTSTFVWLFSVYKNAHNPPPVGSLPVGITFDQYFLLLCIAAALAGGGSVIEDVLSRWRAKQDPSERRSTPREEDKTDAAKPAA